MNEVATNQKRRKPFFVWLFQVFEAWLEKANMRQQVFTILIATVIGILCGLGAVIFRNLIELIHYVFWGDFELSLELIEKAPIWKVVGIPAIGGLIVGPIIYFFAREAKGHGVPEVIAAVALRNGVIRARVVVVKAISSAFTIASGGSAGREGPIIQICSAIGSMVGQYFKVSPRRIRTFVGCGAAGGIAATFNAPIAGALFAGEVILGEFGVARFSPIVVSSVVATVIARHYLGDGSVFEVDYQLVSPFELGPYLVLGILCGLVAVSFIKALYWSEDRFNDLPVVPEMLKPFIGGALLGVIGLWLPHVFSDGYESINMALEGNMAWWLMGILIFAKLAATSLTLGSGGSGGVFAPSLFLGAMAGGVIGKGVAILFGDSMGAAGGYALVGMGGVVAATTHAPISAILIVFEITDDYNIILPLMMVCIISTVISTHFSNESIYTLKLVRQGIDIFRGRSRDVLKGYKVSQCVQKDIERVHPEMVAQDLIDFLIRIEQNHVYVITEQKSLIGLVSLGDLRKLMVNRSGLENVLIAMDLADESVPKCLPHESLSHALLKFERSGLTALPVIEDGKSKKLIGELRYLDVITIYNDEIFKEDTVEELVSRMASTDTPDRVKLVEGFSIMDWSPPSSFWGKTLNDARLPDKYGIRIALIKQRGSPSDPEEDVVPVVPDRDYVITRNDVLLVYGKDEDLGRLPHA